MTRPSAEIPDAVAAIVQAVLDGHPGSEPGWRGHLIVEELRSLGWRIEAPGVEPVVASGAERQRT
ncbi:hypothetical protein OG689_10550 [Kitasatospora sp. NBC_00240]|uniref:hypothetical protein n=1 Tax=Kitasatospora sp. NBC_00240 TaxID=2903567 RepID=UPI002250068F|nr:hypothetical protein [Kitasatospora sp. NBC_00240]MCX5209722.1 hypothetical protein [Kitasatospora sp. NBC_00240]